MAPMHIGYGSPEVQIVAPRKISGPCSARQWRIATISPCAVGSLSRLPELRPRASTRPSLTITAPNGASPSAASAMASRISALSVVVTLLISSLAVVIKRFDRTRASIDFQVVSSEIAFIGKNPKPWHGGWLDHLAATDRSAQSGRHRPAHGQ